jgi:hypothetical protein
VAPTAGTLVLLTAWTVLWCGVVLAVYARVRRVRS